MFLEPGLAGSLGCGPAWHSPAPPRVSSASAQRQGARGRSRVRGPIPRAAGSGREREAAGGRGAAGEAWRLGRLAGPHRAPRPPLPLLAPTSPFPPRAPSLLFGPSVTHRSPRVPPSLFHFPLRNVTLPPPRLPVSSPFASRQGVRGERAKGFGRRVRHRISNYSFLWSLPRSRATPPPTFQLARPQPLGKGPQSVSLGPHVLPGCRLPRVRGTSLSVLYQTRLGFPPLARLAIPPHLDLGAFRGK